MKNYRLIQGQICVQIVKGGDWEPLTKEEADALLDSLSTPAPEPQVANTDWQEQFAHALC